MHIKQLRKIENVCIFVIDGEHTRHEHKVNSHCRFAITPFDELKHVNRCQNSELNVVLDLTTLIR